MWPLVIVNPYEVLEALLLLQEIEGWGLGGFLFQGQMHTLVAAVLLGVAWFDALYPDTEAQPPNRKPGQAEKGIGRSEGDTVIGTDGLWNPELFENTLLGVLGPEGYQGLWDGSVAFDSPEVKQAMEVYGRMLTYINDDHSALSWDQAVKALIEGRCAFNSMGDWAYGEFVNAGLEDNVDFGWVSHPGTDGSFMIVADGFVLANGAPNEEATKDWLRTVGSKEAQEAFNPLKGSICARTDCDRAKFGPYHNWSMDSFSADALVPTVVHGAAAPADFQQALNDAVTIFVVDQDVEAFAVALTQASQMSGIAP